MKIVKKILLILFIILFSIYGIIVTILYFYQDDIKAQFIKEINESINVPLDVSYVELSVFQDFPNVTLLLQNIRLHNHATFNLNNAPPEFKENILQASTLKLHADILELIKDKKVKIKNIEIIDGQINIISDIDGNLNIDLITKNDSSNNHLNIDRIQTQNITINFIDFKNKLNLQLSNTNLKAKIKQNENEWIIGNALSIEELIFTQGKTDVNLNNISGEGLVSYNNNILIIDDLKIKNELAEIHIYSGTIDKNKTELKLKFQEANAQQIIPFIFQNELDKYKINGICNGELALHSVKNKTSINTSISSSEAKFIFEKTPYSVQDIRFSFIAADLSKESTFKLAVQKAQLKSKNLNASLNLKIDDFSKKELELNSAAKYILRNYEDDNFRIDSCLINMNIEKLVLNYEDSITVNSFLNSDLRLKGKIQNLYGNVNDNYTIESLNGLFEIKNNILILSDISFSENNSQYVFSAKMNNLNGAYKNRIMKLKANVSIDYFDLDYHLKLLNQKSTSSDLQYDIILNFKSNHFKYDLFNANNVSGIITFDNNTINLIGTEFNSCGGQIELNANLRKLNENYFIGSEIVINNVNIDSLFYSFRNFNQDFILDKHLKGKSTGTLLVTSEFNDKYEFNWKRLNTELDITIENGELIDFEPMENLSRFADVNELKHIKFSKLENTIFIKDQVVTIPQMDINSSAFNLTISGTHTFDNYFSYHLELLLSDLLSKNRKKKPEESEFGIVEDDGQGRTMLFLNIEGTPDNYKKRYDRKKAREKVSEDFKEEKKELKNIFKEEFKIFRKDSTFKKVKNDESKEKFIIEWEDDKLN